MSTRNRIPGHLRQFVVEQDMDAYDEVEQAVWRFVLLQTYDLLCETAHPAYAEGLAATGISCDRIPSISEMDRCLAEFGWGAVAVDGFIPPRAFQEFQALSILPIAAEIRRPEHLAYTPAPDIIHESAGHAPIIPDPAYRDFLRLFGEVGAGAFSSPGDRALYAAVHHLSEVKEDPSTSPEALRQAEEAFEAARSSVTDVSEAGLLSRLHWWTVEYGLVGTPTDYKIYGAGLLSSVGESHFLHDPSVEKIPLSAECIQTDYDITRQQPQLFVARDFNHLGEVLGEVAAGLAQGRGGRGALQTAIQSEEAATVTLDSGVQILGVLTKVSGDSADAAPDYLQFTGPCALAREDRILDGHGRAAHAEGYGTPLGDLETGPNLARLSAEELGRLLRESTGTVRWKYRSGVEVSGTPSPERSSIAADGQVLVLCMENCTVRRGEEILFRPEWGVYDMALGRTVESVRAGAVDPAYWPTTDFPGTRVPRRAELRPYDADLLALYREALRSWDRPEAPALLVDFERIHRTLRKDFPDDWLLRWNLLECLHKRRRGSALAEVLRGELREIESRYFREAPVSMGLGFLDRTYGAL